MEFSIYIYIYIYFLQRKEFKKKKCFAKKIFQGEEFKKQKKKKKKKKLLYIIFLRNLIQYIKAEAFNQVLTR